MKRKYENSIIDYRRAILSFRLILSNVSITTREKNYLIVSACNINEDLSATLDANQLILASSDAPTTE